MMTNVTWQRRSYDGGVIGKKEVQLIVNFKTYQNIWNGTGKYENGVLLNPTPKLVV